MGSSGTGRLTDYPGSGKRKKPGSKRGGGGAGGSGGSGGGGRPPEDRCGKAFTVILEDVEGSGYYEAHKTVPAIGSAVRVAHKKRIIAETPTGKPVGNLPTNFNYLASCIAAGFSYVGKVTQSTKGPPVATVTIDVAPVAPK